MLQESHQNKIDIRDVTFPTMKSLIDFCYLATLEINMENALDLLAASNMFQFSGIKECCSSFLRSRLDADNCLILQTYADLHSCHQLKNEAGDFSKKNFRKVSQTDEFLNLPLQNVLEFLATDNLSVNSEKDIFEAAIAWLKYDKDREQFTAQLLQLVRLPLLPPKILGRSQLLIRKKIFLHLKAYLFH